MKKADSSNASDGSGDEMQPEYDLDYGKARPNRFATHIKPDTRAVILDPDVASVFTTPESVNAILRALIETMPHNDRTV